MKRIALLVALSTSALVACGAGMAASDLAQAATLPTITAKPGVYVQLCFMETQDGRDHTLLGMERTIKSVR